MNSLCILYLFDWDMGKEKTLRVSNVIGGFTRSHSTQEMFDVTWCYKLKQNLGQEKNPKAKIDKL